MATITAANSIFMLSVATIFTAPTKLQGYGPDDAFDTASLPVGETQMGVDGQLAGGFVYSAVEQDITLLASSISNALFDQWYQAMVQAQDAYPANATIQLPGLGIKWIMTNGFLIDYMIIPSVKRLAQPRRHKIRWQSAVSAPI